MTFGLGINTKGRRDVVRFRRDLGTLVSNVYCFLSAKNTPRNTPESEILIFPKQEARKILSTRKTFSQAEIRYESKWKYP